MFSLSALPRAPVALVKLLKSCRGVFRWPVVSFPVACVTFLARDSMLSALYAIARPSVRPSVCPSVRPSVTRVDQSKTVLFGGG